MYVTYRRGRVLDVNQDGRTQLVTQVGLTLEFRLSQLLSPDMFQINYVCYNKLIGKTVKYAVFHKISTYYYKIRHEI